MNCNRWFVLASLAAALTGCSREAAAPAGAVATGGKPDAHVERVVNVYNWSDYIAPEVITEFTRATGIKVNYDTFDSQEMLETRLLTGRSGFDVVVVSSAKLEGLVSAKVFRKLDYSLLPSSGNLDQGLVAALASFDPGNEHSVGYFWGTTGIAYDAAKLRQLAPGAPVDSWQLVFDPKTVAKLAACGVSVVDAPSELVAVALIAQGKDPNHITDPELATARRLLLGMRPSVRRIDSDSQIEELSSGSICLMITWGTNVVLARRRAQEAGLKPDLRYVIPREGAISWFDTMAIPADAPHPAEAHEFIDFLMHADVAARNADYVGGTTVNAAAVPLIDATLRSDPSIYPTAEVRARLVPQRARTQAQTRSENDVWTAFKRGE